MLPVIELMRVRTLAIDESIRAAARRGTTQVVVLGAGLCARGWRMPELAGSIVYEVDHPATQRYKRTRLKGLEPLARAVRFVSVDFEKDDLARSLERAGHDARTTTTWIWEGVTPYLTRRAIQGTLETIHARSAKGSTLVMTYYTPPSRSVGNGGGVRQPRHALLWSRVVLAVLGEPFRGLMTVGAMHDVLAVNGFRIETDATNAELAKGDPLAPPMRRPSDMIVRERIVVATH